ncbi:unnamed protein product [Heterosigma akashiwo]
MDANSSSEKQQSFAVVVLGDIGRSPRMQYHAISLQKQCNFQVSLVGYEGEKCIPAVESNNKIQIYTVKHFDGLLMLRKLLFPLYAALKVTILLLRLLITLLWVIPRPRAILVQNPPSIPSLAVVWFVCKLRQSHMIIDWHNLGYTVLGYSIGQKHPLVWLSKVYERFFGRLGSAHFCVTKAMSKWLKAEFGVEAMVLYDKPPRWIVENAGCPTLGRLHNGSLIEQSSISIACGLRMTTMASLSMQHTTMERFGKKKVGDGKGGRVSWSQRPQLRRSDRLMKERRISHPDEEDPGAICALLRATKLNVWGGEEGYSFCLEHQKIIEEGKLGGKGRAKRARKKRELARRPRGDPRRPLLLVSSTSWTPDEDFGVLLRALAAADGRLGRPLVVCVTGKGPQKEMYERLIGGMVLKDVEIHTLWLEPEDYPLFLGACDLGVCLHKSTSGLDLPMKVLDMFGSGMPVCAVDFPCLDELVVHGKGV